MAKGKLTVIGFGPGSYEDMTVRAINAIKDADIVTGYTVYVDLLKQFFPKKEYKSTGMMKEVARCRMAIGDALRGKKVALVSSGDSGIYGMSGLVFELVYDMDADIDVDVVPGITAASSGAAVLGAPLMHDTVLISLSDWMTPIEKILKRIECAGQSDLVIALYSPRSKSRPNYLDQATDILLKYRSSETVVGIVRQIGRRDQHHALTTLGKLKETDVDMFCCVIIGNAQTYAKNGRMITPRGYRESEDQGF